MTSPKDNFSKQSDLYAKYRPVYPQALYSFLMSLVEHKNVAWDCATGNGQVANELANYFDTVYATDISEQQIKNADQKDNVIYRVERAESTSFDNNRFDLITVAQAIHWFNFERFYQEVNRTIKQHGVLAVIGYGLLKIDPSTDKIINHFYHNIIGPYWDKERKFIDEYYQTIPFPFKEITSPQISNYLDWTRDELLGYLETWSAVQHYKKSENSNPLDFMSEKLKKAWPDDNSKKIQFPLLLRVARIE